LVDQLGSYDRDDLRPEGFDRFDDRDRFDNSRRDQAFERALEQEMRMFEQDRAVEEIMKAIINDPNMIMDDNGVISRIDRPTKTTATRPKTTATRRVRATPISGRERIRRSGQFSRLNILPPIPKPRKKNKKHCKNLSKCFREANSKLRLKNGKLRKGKTQSDVAKMAHRLLKKIK
tara:strand:+ start:572 stop:1099 length:528 start_codon:yes stop_codon:yes gene_type:complete